jgi:hypothetical protein
LDLQPTRPLLPNLHPVKFAIIDVPGVFQHLRKKILPVFVVRFIVKTQVTNIPKTFGKLHRKAST